MDDGVTLEGEFRNVVEPSLVGVKLEVGPVHEHTDVG